jgi:hypothetical protein
MRTQEIAIRDSPLDAEFRDVCTDFIEKASKEMIVIAGELGSLLFPDMQRATYDAVRRHVQVKMYATERVPQYLRNFALSIGCELSIGHEPAADHYLVIDRKHFVISRKSGAGIPTPVGKRQGVAYLDNPDGAAQVVALFNKLSKRAHKISKINKLADAGYSFVSSQ